VDDSSGEWEATTAASARAPGPETFPEAADAIDTPVPIARKTAKTPFFMIPASLTRASLAAWPNYHAARAAQLTDAEPQRFRPAPVRRHYWQARNCVIAKQYLLAKA
jgi:hypothetical protein